MNIPGLVVVILGFVFLIYSFKNKNKVNINNSNKFVILNKEKFLKIQLSCSIFNSICMIIFGRMVIRYNLHSMYVVLYPLVFLLIDYMVIPISSIKQYIKHK